MTVNTTVFELTMIGFSEVGHFWPLFFFLLLIIYFLTISGNVSISILILADRHLHTPMYLFISMLSFLEIFFTTVTIPFMLTCLWRGQVQILFNHCVLQMYLLHSLGITQNYLLNVMAYDRMVAICNPLRYHTIMTSKRCTILLSSCCLLGFTSPIVHLLSVLQLPLCGPNTINHIFCDLAPLLKMACTDIHFTFILNFLISLCIISSTFFFIIVTYIKIIFTILRMSSMDGRQKAFSTCASHLTMVLLFYGSLAFIYIRPKVEYTQEYDKLVAINYSVLIPFLNPIIYSFRNKEIKRTFKKLLKRFNTIFMPPIKLL
ncbi:olfactory receptor 6N1-like [Bufo gargarizans]|uniref:olfactory receptor 6N1-like n=1 Tax=Bufo gargarizans TaxID=30331 RepID=UPI001CF5C8E0|nr:olfactory receptor 6N1-like [Bufo gargarizans]